MFVSCLGYISPGGFPPFLVFLVNSQGHCDCVFALSLSLPVSLSLSLPPFRPFSHSLFLSVPFLLSPLPLSPPLYSLFRPPSPLSLFLSRSSLPPSLPPSLPLLLSLISHQIHSHSNSNLLYLHDK